MEAITENLERIEAFKEERKRKQLIELRDAADEGQMIEDGRIECLSMDEKSAKAKAASDKLAFRRVVKGECKKRQNCRGCVFGEMSMISGECTACDFASEYTTPKKAKLAFEEILIQHRAILSTDEAELETLMLTKVKPLEAKIAETKAYLEKKESERKSIESAARAAENVYQ